MKNVAYNNEIILAGNFLIYKPGAVKIKSQCWTVGCLRVNTRTHSLALYYECSSFKGSHMTLLLAFFGSTGSSVINLSLCFSLSFFSFLLFYFLICAKQINKWDLRSQNLTQHEWPFPNLISHNSNQQQLLKNERNGQNELSSQKCPHFEGLNLWLVFTLSKEQEQTHTK